MATLFAKYTYAQDSLTSNKNFYYKYIAVPKQLHKERFKYVSIGSGVLWGGSLIFLNEIWYKQYPKSPFHLFNDSGEWQLVDKVGHGYSACLGSKLFYTFFRWTGLNEKKSILYGVGGGLAYQSIIEILDGYSAKWGFSMADMTANTIGCGFFAGQQLLWHEQRIFYKYSTHYNIYKDPILLKRANELYGASSPERIFKDYNAQTYWLSANIKSFMPKSKWPAWLNLAVGYGASNMYGGYTNSWVDPTSGSTINRTDLPRYKQFYFAPDIDFSRIPWRSKFMRDFTKMINLKAPLPSIEFNTLGQVKFNAMHF